jgi:hypothetical protein
MKYLIPRNGSAVRISYVVGGMGRLPLQPHFEGKIFLLSALMTAPNQTSFRKCMFCICPKAIKTRTH